MGWLNTPRLSAREQFEIVTVETMICVLLSPVESSATYFISPILEKATQSFHRLLRHLRHGRARMEPGSSRVQMVAEICEETGIGLKRNQDILASSCQHYSVSLLDYSNN